MSKKSSILVVGKPKAEEATLINRFSDDCELIQARGPMEALSKLNRSCFQGIFVVPGQFDDYLQIGRILQNEKLLDAIPDGIALLDDRRVFVWANSALKALSGCEELTGRGFYDVFASQADRSGLCPFKAALSSGRNRSAILPIAGPRYLQVHVAPMQDREHPPNLLIVTVHDVTQEVLQRQKLDAIHRAGTELTDLKPEEIFNMSMEDRVELLKSNILHFTKDVLDFNVVEVRLLDQRTGELVPLLAEGMDEHARTKVLFAARTGNGVTGYVADSGKSYLCRDTTKDPLYLPGFAGARSSVTVPIIQHEDIIGTFNVESPVVGAFTENDVQFLEIFCRSVAASLNTFELLVAQQANATLASVEAIHGAVALPVDEILNDVVNVMELYLSTDRGEATDNREVTSRLHRVLKNARFVKQQIQKVGERMAPAEAGPDASARIAFPRLKSARVLVVDCDEAVRQAAHAMLERQGCVVETAHEGAEAILMVRAAGKDDAYDVILTDIRLPDLSGYELFIRLKEVIDHVPLILMTGFGYDPGHSIVNARKAGLLPNAVLYKPFRLNQLLETVDAVIGRTHGNEDHRDRHS